MSITVKEITTTAGLKKFIQFPHSLYKGNNYWVPPLHQDEMNTLRRDKNPAFDYSEARYWMAYKEQRPVGRIAAIINHRANQKWGCKHIRFGWVDFIEEIDVARALFNEVEKWALEKGMEAIEGPFGFTDMDFEGMLIEGFDKLGTIANIYNHSYYPLFVEQLGFKPKEDWVQFTFDAPQPVPEKVERLNALIMNKYKLRYAHFNKKRDMIKYGKKFFDTLNKSYVNLYGFVDLTEKEIDKYIKSYLGFLLPELVGFVLDEQDNVVAFGIAMPSLSKAFQKANGKLFPFGFIHILKAMKQRDRIDLFLTGVHPDWQKKGVVSIYFCEMNKIINQMGFKRAISSHQLVTNHDAISMWNSYEHELCLRRRSYIKEL